jgi:hypothetical protein
MRIILPVKKMKKKNFFFQTELAVYFSFFVYVPIFSFYSLSCPSRCLFLHGDDFRGGFDFELAAGKGGNLEFDLLDGFVEQIRGKSLVHMNSAQSVHRTRLFFKQKPLTNTTTQNRKNKCLDSDADGDLRCADLSGGQQRGFESIHTVDSKARQVDLGLHLDGVARHSVAHNGQQLRVQLCRHLNI